MYLHSHQHHLPYSHNGLVRGWHLHAQTHRAFKIIAPPILNQIIHHQHTHKEHHRLKPLEMQRHGLVDDPPEHDKERRDEQGDLQGTADGDADGEIHLVLVRDDAGRDVLGRVADDGQQDEADEGLGDVRGFDDGVDAVDEVLCAHGDEDRDHGEGYARRHGREEVLALGLAFLAVFFVEEVGVAAELEEEEEDVED